MQLSPTIRAASILSYIMGIGTLLALGPSLAYNLVTGTSRGSLLGIDPSYGDFLGSNPIGRLWGYPGALVFGLAFLVVAALCSRWPPSGSGSPLRGAAGSAQRWRCASPR